MTIKLERTTQTVADLIGVHAGEDIFVCGTGTSLKGFDWTRLNGRVTIALNDAVNAKGFIPTYHLFADDTLYERYLRWHPDTTVVVPEDTAHMLDTSAPRHVTWTKVFKHEHTVSVGECDPRWPEPYGRMQFSRPDVSLDGPDLYCLCTVAISGLQMAYKLGAKNIYLLGADAYEMKDSTYWDGRCGTLEQNAPPSVDLGDGRIKLAKHWYWDIEMHRLREWFTEIGFYAEGRAVYNCGAQSTLTAWPKVSLNDVLQESE